MKTRNFITIAILIFGMNSAFAGSDPAMNVPSETAFTALRPVSPSEATFSDVVPGPSSKPVELAPAAPAVASFDESAMNEIRALELMKELAPVAPKEAGFEGEKTGNDSVSVVPVTPKEADFSDTL